MLRSVILMAAIILVAVMFIAPSLPSAENSGVLVEGEANDAPTRPSQPQTVDRVFQSGDMTVIEQPYRTASPDGQNSNLVNLPPPGSAEAEAARSDEY